MHDTYGSKEEADADKRQQSNLLKVLGGWDRALRRDECGAWSIFGQHGKILTWGDGKRWVLVLGCEPGDGRWSGSYAWGAAKRKLKLEPQRRGQAESDGGGWATVIQDGDGEGCIRLERLPTTEQAEVIREVMGLRKRREDSPETIERARQRLGTVRQAWDRI